MNALLVPFAEFSQAIHAQRPTLSPESIQAAIAAQAAADPLLQPFPGGEKPKAPHSRTNMRRIGLPLMMAGQLADALTTHQALNRGAVEMNPLLGEKPSLGKLLAVKAAVNLPLGWLLDRMAGYKPKTAMGLALGAGGVGGAMAMRNHTKGRK